MVAFTKVRVQGNLKLHVRRGEGFSMESDVLDFDRTDGQTLILFSSSLKGMTQVNRGNSTGFQTVVTGGVVFIGANMPETPLPEATLTVPVDWNGEVWLDSKKSQFGENPTGLRTQYNPNF